MCRSVHSGRWGWHKTDCTLAALAISCGEAGSYRVCDQCTSQETQLLNYCLSMNEATNRCGQLQFVRRPPAVQCCAGAHPAASTCCCSTTATERSDKQFKRPATIERPGAKMAPAKCSGARGAEVDWSFPLAG